MTPGYESVFEALEAGVYAVTHNYDELIYWSRDYFMNCGDVLSVPTFETVINSIEFV